MRYGSVCSGIEAATVAWKPLGWSASFFSEIDAFPRAVLEYHYPEVPLHGDFTTIQDGDYDAIDLLVGGTPCQSFSVAGLRKGLDDPRGNLMLGYGSLAQRLRPTWLVWENVPGVLSANRGRDFGTFLGMLAELGYGFAYRVLDAQHFGVAQRRRRVFVVGYLGDWRPPAAVLFERHSLSGHPAPSREAREETTGTLSSRTSGGGGLGTDFECAGGLQPVGFRMAAFGEYSGDGTASNMKARDYKDATDLVVHGAQDTCTSDRAFALGRNSGQENAVFVSLRGRDGGATAELGGPIAGTLRAATGGGDKPHVMCFAENSRSEVRLEGGDGSRTGALSTGGGKPGQGMPMIAQGITIHGTDKTAKAVSYTDLAGALRARPPGSIENSSTTAVHDKMAVRRLTPVECERLQGFPDNFTRIPYRNKPADKCPDGPRYKALGNSMAVPVMAWIGNRIKLVSETLSEKRSAA